MFYYIIGANPFPEVTDPSCRLPLPTFFYMTRGYAPWRPAAVVGTASALLVRACVFTGPHTLPGLFPCGRGLPRHSPVRRLGRFPGQCLREWVIYHPPVKNVLGGKESSSRDVCGRPLARAVATRTARSGILAGCPFDAVYLYDTVHCACMRLRTDSPMATRCCHGTLLRFSLLPAACISRHKIVATPTKIRTRGCSTPPRDDASAQPPRPLTLSP